MTNAQLSQFYDVAEIVVENINQSPRFSIKTRNIDLRNKMHYNR